MKNKQVEMADSTTSKKSVPPGTFNFPTLAAAVALYLDAMKGRDKIQKDLDNHEVYMSDIVKAMLDQFGTPNEQGQKSLQLDLGDGNPRGYVAVQRTSRGGDKQSYFIRARNAGRPLGSKNKNTLIQAMENRANLIKEHEAPSMAPSPPSVRPMSSFPMPASVPSQTGNPVVDAIMNLTSEALRTIGSISHSTFPPGFDSNNAQIVTE
jgi:hypothetical protein